MKKVVGMFPGQGSQYVGMANEWYKKYDIVKQKFDRASEILKFDLAEKCFAEGGLKELTKTENAQPALLVCSIAMFDVLKEQYDFHYLIGHSLGEISALTAAGVLSFEDAVSLVRLRGEAMRDCSLSVKTGMTAVSRLGIQKIQKVLDSMYLPGNGLCIANYNADSQIIISGSIADLQKAEEKLEEKGAYVTRLNVSGAFHSRYMENAVAPLREKLQEIVVKEPDIPVISGFTNEFYDKKSDIREMLANQVTQQVMFAPMVKKLKTKNIGLWLEVGPGEVLKKLVLRNAENAAAFSFDKESDEIQNQYKQVEKQNESEPNIVGLCLGQAVATRNRNTEESGYTEGVLKPYKMLQNYNQEWKGKKLLPEKEREAIELLKKIMDTKHVPVEEQISRISGICEEAGRYDLWKKMYE